MNQRLENVIVGIIFVFVKSNVQDQKKCQKGSD